MNAYLTFDYELYFGAKTGTPEKSILEPTEKLMQIANKYNARLVFFVDAGYLTKLAEYSKKYQSLSRQYDLIRKQMAQMCKYGHEVQLHIHPHWEDANFNGESWNMDLNRYQLASFSPEQIQDIVLNYKTELSKHTDKPAFAYRAGGWCIQPFDEIGKALEANNIWLDSTVYTGGYNSNEIISFDFTTAPDKDIYKFSDDPTIENEKGFFTELPISAIEVSPFFYWQLLYSKIFPLKGLEKFGDGSSVEQSKKQLLKLLTGKSSMAASTDGLKAKLLNTSVKKGLKRKNQHFVTVGHPKSTTEFSLKAMEDLFRSYNNHVNFTNFAGISD